MFKHTYFELAVSLILLLSLSACSQGQATEEAASPAVTESATQTVQTFAKTGKAALLTGKAVKSPAPLKDRKEGTPSASQVSLKPLPQALTAIQVVKALTPSVVQILTEIIAMDAFNQPGVGMGVGTGIILDERGHILTNNHVIAGAQRVTVTLSNGGSFPAEIVGGDAATDTAVIRIKAEGLQPAKLGHSSDLQVGEDVIAIGHALGLKGGPTVSKGVVSAIGRSIDTGPQTTMLDLIQTDAAINPGNSGGPLSNTQAEVIGINTAGFQGSQGISFAINIDDAKAVVAQLMEKGFVERGGLGIAPFNLNAGIADQIGVPVAEGVAVARVFPDTAAEEAGLQERDVIVRLGDEPIRNTGDLSRFLMAHLPGETVTVVYFRGGEEKTTEVTLQERPVGRPYGQP